MSLISAIITDAVQEALGLERDDIQKDVRDLALSVCNEKGRIIWDQWRWDNEKMDEFTTSAASAAGVIELPATVDVVRAIKGLSDGCSSRVWSEDELIAAAAGETVSSGRFQHLADSATGCRRITVGAESAAATYRCLALRRWVDAIVNPAYSVSNPTATPTDYRVMTFAIDRAEPALRAYVKDALRTWAGTPALGNGDQLLQMAVRKDTYDVDRDRRVLPRSPMFEEVGNWDGS